MIQANELRINNYVNYNDGSGKDDIRQVVGIDKNSITAVVKGCRFTTAIKSNELIYAIPLTEEILLNCGFVKSERRTEWDYKLSISAITLRCRYNTEWYFELDGIYLGSNPKYLHTLQNLYFSITGQELEIKL